MAKWPTVATTDWPSTIDPNGTSPVTFATEIGALREASEDLQTRLSQLTVTTSTSLTFQWDNQKAVVPSTSSVKFSRFGKFMFANGAIYTNTRNSSLSTDRIFITGFPAAAGQHFPAVVYRWGENTGRRTIGASISGTGLELGPEAGVNASANYIYVEFSFWYEAA